MKRYRCFFEVALLSIFFIQIECIGAATSNHSGPYDNERPAWGGNGGWWGDSHGNWYADRDVLEEDRYLERADEPTHPPRGYPHGGYHPNTYEYNNQYPNTGAIEPNDPGLVDGAALYIQLNK